jgi:hypothetical protein
MLRRRTADCARRADRLVRLSVPLHELGFRLTHPNAFWIVNLPPDFEMVGSWVDLATRQVVFIILSAQFVRIAREAPISESQAACNGKKWHPEAHRRF